MTGNLSRTVLRGAGARESACLPDLTKVVYIFIKKTEKPISFQSKEVGFSVAEFSCMCQCLATS